jgi:hypothetical protein
LSLTAGAPPAIASLAEGVLAVNTTSAWKWVVLPIALAGVLGTGVALGWPQPNPKGKLPAPDMPPPVNPDPRTPKKGEADPWFPQPPDGGPVPSAFPELALPAPDPTGVESMADFRKRYDEAFAKFCPHIAGKAQVTVEPTDDALRKVIKAQLHQGILQMRRYRERIRVGSWSSDEKAALAECLVDMQAVVFELWGAQPKELVPWLEELVVAAKHFERFIRLRVESGSEPPQAGHAATRLRLRMEAALLKAKRRT